MTDTIWQPLIAEVTSTSTTVLIVQCVVGGIVTLLLAWMQMRTTNKVALVAKVAEKSVELAANTEATVAKVAEKTEEIAKVAISSHELINGGRADDLEIVAVLTRQLADDKPTEKRLAAAEMAERKLAAHLALERQTKETVAAVVESSEKK